jgi:hypothetical protein
VRRTSLSLPNECASSTLAGGTPLIPPNQSGLNIAPVSGGSALQQGRPDLADQLTDHSRRADRQPTASRLFT